MKQELKVCIAALIIGMFLSGCIKEEAKCNPPYINSTGGCCLDVNNNLICDREELPSNKTENATQNDSCVIIEFYGEGCHFCANMIPIVSQVENETGVKFRRLEVWYNKTNQEIFKQYQASITKDCGAFGVPAFVSLETNKSKCGEMSLVELENFVIENSACAKH